MQLWQKILAGLLILSTTFVSVLPVPINRNVVEHDNVQSNPLEIQNNGVLFAQGPSLPDAIQMNPIKSLYPDQVISDGHQKLVPNIPESYIGENLSGVNDLVEDSHVQSNTYNRDVSHLQNNEASMDNTNSNQPRSAYWDMPGSDEEELHENGNYMDFLGESASDNAEFYNDNDEKLSYYSPRGSIKVPDLNNEHEEVANPINFDDDNNIDEYLSYQQMKNKNLGHNGENFKHRIASTLEDHYYDPNEDFEIIDIKNFGPNIKDDGRKMSVGYRHEIEPIAGNDILYEANNDNYHSDMSELHYNKGFRKQVRQVLKEEMRDGLLEDMLEKMKDEIKDEILEELEDEKDEASSNELDPYFGRLPEREEMSVIGIKKK